MGLLNVSLALMVRQRRRSQESIAKDRAKRAQEDSDTGRDGCTKQQVTYLDALADTMDHHAALNVAGITASRFRDWVANNGAFDEQRRAVWTDLLEVLKTTVLRRAIFGFPQEVYSGDGRMLGKRHIPETALTLFLAKAELGMSEQRNQDPFGGDEAGFVRYMQTALTEMNRAMGAPEPPEPSEN